MQVSIWSFLFKLLNESNDKLENSHTDNGWKESEKGRRDRKKEKDWYKTFSFVFKFIINLSSKLNKPIACFMEIENNQHMNDSTYIVSFEQLELTLHYKTYHI